MRFRATRHQDPTERRGAAWKVMVGRDGRLDGAPAVAGLICSATTLEVEGKERALLLAGWTVERMGRLAAALAKSCRRPRHHDTQ